MHKTVDRSQQPPLRPLSDLHLPLPERRVLKNGIPVTLVNIGGKQVVRIDILFKAGTWCQTQKLQALFTNRMLREGTKKYSHKMIAEQLDFYGAWIDLSCGAMYSCITLYSLSHHFHNTLDILESIIKEPLFDENQLEVVKDMNVQQFLVNESQVDFLAHRSLLNMLMGDTHPYGKRTVKEDYNAITRDLLQSFYNEHFHSGNCQIFIAGNISDELIEKVEDSFGSTEFGKVKENETDCRCPVFTPSEEGRRFILKEDAYQSAVCLGMPTLHRTDEDYQKFKVVLALFGGYFGSRLVSNIREDKGYTYHIAADITHYPFSSFLIIHTECDSEYVEPLIREVHNEIDRLHTELISEGELSKLKNYMIGELCRGYESAFSIADAWMFTFTSGLSDDYFQKSLDAIKEITIEEVRDLSVKYLRKENLKEVIAGKKLL